MTISSRSTMVFETAPVEAPSPAIGIAERLIADPRDRKIFPIAMLGLVVLFGLLQNPYWVPAGDSEAYIATARDLVRGHGYQFNGQPVAMYPPGWPALMAAVMTVSPYFLPLKLLAMTCMIGALACGYFVVRRFVGPGQSALIILLTACLSHVYTCTFWLVSEGLFCLVSSAAMLLAFQINEGRRQWWRIITVGLLCAAAVSVRWAGVLGCLLVAAILFDRQFFSVCRKQWIAIGLAVALTGVAFFGWREALEVTPEQAAAVREFGGAGEDIPTISTPLTDQPVTQQYALITTTLENSHASRVFGWGRWFSWLFWQPFRAAAGSMPIEIAANIIGWIIILLLGITTVAALLRRRWIWLALGAYCGALALNWPNPNARYLVPVAFLLVLGVVLAAEHLLQWVRNPIVNQIISTLLTFFIASVLLCNLALWAIEVRVAHADDFYATYEAGLNQNLIGATRLLNDLEAQDGVIGITNRYINLGRQRYSPFGLRATALLTGRSIVSAPYKLTSSTLPQPRLVRWLYRNGIRYYLHQPPVSPWRVWHFRVPWWQQIRTEQPAYDAGAGWRLYHLDGPDQITRLSVPPSSDWPTRVPGL